LKKIISELDRISSELEASDEQWAFYLSCKLDRISSEIESLYDKKDFSKLAAISSNVLEQYLDRMQFLSSNSTKLANLIKNENIQDANLVYKKIKKHFGKLTKKESIEFITNIFKKNISGGLQ
jgi:hypothetical protein